MKQLLFSKALLSAATLMVGALAFTACSNEEFDGNTNPTYDGESVKTQFAINIPVAGKSTRLGQNIVQGQVTPQFRGMTNIRLVPFTDASIKETTTSLINPIALGSIGNGDLKENGNYKVYNDVDIPVGVQNFLFYGEASEGTGTGSLENGEIIPSYEVSGWPLNSTLAGIQFDLKPIIGTGSVTESQNILAQMLTDIASVTGTPNGTAWSAVGTGELKTYYGNFVSLKAGSANSIKAALQELYNSVKDEKVADVDGLKEKIAEEITETYFEATGPTDGKYTLNWKSGIPENIKNFPNNLGLPDGSQQLAFTNSKFAYPAPSTSVVDGNILQQTAYNKYVYPASLFYTVNTGIKVSNSTMATGGVYDGTYSDWNGILGLRGFTDGPVTESTQSIALINPIQYAVASLNLFVRFADTYIYDNGDNWPDIKPVGQIAVPVPDEGFPLNGILIGGQKPVKWDFTTTDTDDDEAWTIYDASMNNAVVKKASTYLGEPTAYTLALETKGAGGGGETVRFALEMTNDSGADFIGVDGIVPAGGKFYLVGTLTSDATNTKVFEQDHKTVAKVTINSLKSAYNCIPDLRSPKLELGLSVDLEWQKGLEDEVTIQ